MKKNQLIQFAQDTLTSWDAIVENNDGQLGCLLPPTLAQQLALPEESTISLPSPHAEHPLIFGEPLLDNLIELIQGEGRWTQISINDLSSRSGGLNNIFRRVVQIKNADGEVKNVSESTGSYIILHYRCGIQCQEETRGYAGFLAFNEETLAETPWLHERLHRYHLKEAPSLKARKPFEEILPYIEKRLQMHAERAVEPFMQDIQHKISQERRRLERQHRRDRKAILKPIIKDLSIDPTEAMAQLAKIEQEYIDQITPLPSQYPIHAHIEPYALARVSMPVTKIDFHIRRRKQTRDLRWYWNPMIETFEYVLCEGCQKETHHFTTGDDLKLLCKTCAQ